MKPFFEIIISNKSLKVKGLNKKSAQLNLGEGVNMEKKSCQTKKKRLTGSQLAFKAGYEKAKNFKMGKKEV